jgi:flagellin
MISGITNTPSQSAQFASANNRNLLNQTYERLASGQKINSASDNAAGLAVVERMLSELNGFDQAMRNASDGISVVQTADSYVTGISDDLQRMRELAVQSANGTLNSADRASLNKEFTSLQENINKRIDTADYNGQKLLTEDGSIDIQVDASAGEQNQIAIRTQDLSAATDTGIGAVLDSGMDINSQDGAYSALAAIDDALSTVNAYRADLGASENRFDSNIRNLQDRFVASSAARSRILDTDYAQETARQAANQIREQANIAMLGQANQMLPQMVTSLLNR